MVKDAPVNGITPYAERLVYLPKRKYSNSKLDLARTGLSKIRLNAPIVNRIYTKVDSKLTEFDVQDAGMVISALAV